MGCSQPVADLVSGVSLALTGSERAQVVFVCPSSDPLLSGTQSGLEQELQQLLEVQEAMDAAELNHFVLYLSEDLGGFRRKQDQRRSLVTSGPFRQVPEPLKGFGNYTTCGTLCQVRDFRSLLPEQS